MIRYRLRCADGHAFDGWFRSSDDFERQRGTDVLACPECGTPDVDRALMAPAIARGGGAIARTEDVAMAAEPVGSAEAGEASAEAHRRELFRMLQAMARRVRAAGVDVGEDFPEEARRIHHGEAEARDIYGKASPDEARALLEEGIEVLPLPILPEDRN